MKARQPKSASSPAGEDAASKAAAHIDSFPVVAIGASAGGLEAYTEFFKALPANTGMAFVVVQHLDPNHRSLLADIISKTAKMPVEEVTSGQKLRPNCAYVIPHNTLMAIVDGRFTLTPRGKEPRQHLSVNFFMRSLAQERQSRAIGIVLSGTGADGTLGLEDIKAEGGITFAQDPASAKYDGMPRSAIDSGCVDFVLPPKEIAKELQWITQHPYVRQEPDAAEIEPLLSGTKDFTGVIDQLRRASGADFRQYKPNTIQRRAMRRMLILKLNSAGEYTRYLKEHPEEAEKLYDDILIPVTSFFRDFEAFEALKSDVYPVIVKNKTNKGTIRMWAPGCSTGEETYSLAMTLLEFLGDKAASFHVQIFGTDLNEKGIQKARTGVYRESIAEEISPERMRRFFVKVNDGYRVNKAVRDMCVFARQNLANDPPFSQMNVVACRNLLIYVQPVLQKKIIPILHYALKPSGFLVLGSAESVSAFPDLFSTVDKKHKIYAKKATASRLHYDFSQTYYPAGSGANGPSKMLESKGSSEPEVDMQVEADRVVLKNYAPVGVVVNDAMEVIQFRGRTTPYLEPAPGKASLNVLKLARNGLGVELRTLISSARESGAPVKKDGVLFSGNAHKRILNISVSPLGEKGPSTKESHFLILFEDVTAHGMAGSEQVSERRTKKGAENKHESRQLKGELADAKDALRVATESEDALREEFQSANEEILSANEELQSTNEELETSKEELQSANEELNTVNDELRGKNTELHDLGNDISNLLNSTRIPVVMLDRRFRIRRLTPNAHKLLKAVSSDVGRSISDLKLNIKVPDLEEMITNVLDRLQPSDRDVQDLEDHWYSLQILPYQTHDNKIDGAVLALLDIDAVKRSEQQLKKIIDHVPKPLLVLDADLRVLLANLNFYSTFQVPEAETLGVSLMRLGSGQWNIPKLLGLLEEVLPRKQQVLDYEVTHDFPKIGPKTMLVSAAQVESTSQGRPEMILVAFQDITERKLAENSLRAREERFRHLSDYSQTVMNTMAEGLYTVDTHGLLTYINPSAEKMFGWTRAEFLGKKMHDITHYKHPDGTPFPASDCPSLRVLQEEVELRDHPDAFIRKDGSFFPVIFSAAPLREDGKAIGIVVGFRDDTQRQQAEEEMKQSHANLESMVEHRTAAVRELSSSLLRSRDDERRKISRDLHDSLGQLLAFAKMSLETLKRPEATEKERQGFLHLMDTLDKCLAETRTMAHLLHPPLLDELGLSAASKFYVEGFSERSGIPVTLTTTPELKRLPFELELGLFRILQESLTNIHRHAHSSSVDIQLKLGADHITLQVKDYGQGMSAEMLEQFRKNGTGGGVGLLSMYERISELSGRLEIQSDKNGTLIEATAPLPDS